MLMTAWPTIVELVGHHATTLGYAESERKKERDREREHYVVYSTTV